jgi:hypothetical protein
MSDSIHSLSQPILIAIRAITGAITACRLGDLLSLDPITDLNAGNSDLKIMRFAGSVQLLKTAAPKTVAGRVHVRLDDSWRWVPATVEFTHEDLKHVVGCSFYFDGDQGNLVLDMVDQSMAHAASAETRQPEVIRMRQQQS